MVFSFVPVSCPSEVFFSPDDESALSKSSVFSHDATSIRPNKEVNHGETCVLFSILSSSFFFFFFFLLSEDARARGLRSRVCVLERDFLFFSVSAMGSRSRAPVLWDRATRMTLRETNGFIRSLSGCERFFSRSNVTQNFFSGGVF